MGVAEGTKKSQPSKCVIIKVTVLYQLRTVLEGKFFFFLTRIIFMTGFLLAERPGLSRELFGFISLTRRPRQSSAISMNSHSNFNQGKKRENQQNLESSTNYFCGVDHTPIKTNPAHATALPENKKCRL